MTDISHIFIAFIRTLHFTSTGTGQTPYCQPMLAHHPTGPILSICSDISNSYLDTSPSVCAVACRPSHERRECHRADAQTRPKVPSGLTSATEHASLAAPFSCTMSVLEPTRKTPWVESPYVRSLLVSSIFLSYHFVFVHLRRHSCYELVGGELRGRSRQLQHWTCNCSS